MFPLPNLLAVGAIWLLFILIYAGIWIHDKISYRRKKK